MADIRTLVDNVLAAADVAASLIPGSTDDNLVAAGRTLVGLVDTLTGAAPGYRREVTANTRAALAAAVSAKAERTADRLEG